MKKNIKKTELIQYAKKIIYNRASEREINQPSHTAGEIKKSLIYIGNLSITKYYTKS